MTSSTLMGSNFVSEEEVFAVPAVPFTKSHFPVHHKDFINSVKNAVRYAGFNIVKAQYVLGHQGQQMFSVWDLDKGNSSLCWSLGLINSLNKSLSLRLLAGNRIFICQNLSFAADYVKMRRHTSGLTTEQLYLLAISAVQNVIGHMERHQIWHDSLRNYLLDESDMNTLLFRAISNSVIPASKFHQFNELYRDVYREDDLFSWHECFTHMFKETNLLTLPQRNNALHQIINGYIDSLDVAQPSPLGDFYQQRALTR